MTDLLVAVVAMFGAGVAAFASPCVAPLVPGYLAVLADAGRGRPVAGDGRGGTDLRAVWRVLPAFLARHLWRAWSTVAEALTPETENRSSVPAPTRTRWRTRLRERAVVPVT